MSLPSEVEGVLRRLLPGTSQWHRELLAQLPHATAEPGCKCGCPTVDLVVDSSAVPPASGQHGKIADATWEDGGVLLFVRDGYLSLLEAYFHEDPVAEWPRPEELTLG